MINHLDMTTEGKQDVGTEHHVILELKKQQLTNNSSTQHEINNILNFHFPWTREYITKFIEGLQ